MGKTIMMLLLGDAQALIIYDNICLSYSHLHLPCSIPSLPASMPTLYPSLIYQQQMQIYSPGQSTYVMRQTTNTQTVTTTHIPLNIQIHVSVLFVPINEERLTYENCWLNEQAQESSLWISCHIEWLAGWYS